MLDIIKIFESLHSPLFILVEINILVGSLGIVLLPRIIYAALCLAFVLINIALLYLLFNAEFLAAAQVLIYVGAINVLIIFAIMLVNIPSYTANYMFNLGGIVSAICVTGLFWVLLEIISQMPITKNNLSLHIISLDKIGTILLQDLLLPFELLSLLLLVSLVGAITIARKEIEVK